MCREEWNKLYFHITDIILIGKKPAQNPTTNNKTSKKQPTNIKPATITNQQRSPKQTTKIHNSRSQWVKMNHTNSAVLEWCGVLIVPKHLHTSLLQMTEFLRMIDLAFRFSVLWKAFNEVFLSAPVIIPNTSVWLLLKLTEEQSFLLCGIISQNVLAETFIFCSTSFMFDHRRKKLFLTCLIT